MSATSGRSSPSATDLLPQDNQTHHFLTYEEDQFFEVFLDHDADNKL